MILRSNTLCGSCSIHQPGRRIEGHGDGCSRPPGTSNACSRAARMTGRYCISIGGPMRKPPARRLLPLTSSTGCTVGPRKPHQPDSTAASLPTGRPYEFHLDPVKILDLLDFIRLALILRPVRIFVGV